jgi:phosphatidylinositol alpha-1,6-mannosyltransferase
MTTASAILAIVTDAFGGRGGIAQYNRDFLGALAETRALSSITVLPRQSPDKPELPQGIKQTPARPGWIGYSVAALGTAMFRRVDLVFCGHLFMVPLAALISRIKRAKLIVQTHGVEVWQCPSWPQRAALEAADLVLCVSRHTRAAVLSWADIAPERVLVVPNTFREAFSPGDGSPLRTALALEGKHVLLTVGRMDSRERYKGQDRVIAAIPDLVAKGYDIHYIVIGDGDDRTRLEALARDVGVSERVYFLGDVELQTLVHAYRMADLFVMPSTGEGFGVAFLEAMASDTRAVGLDVAGSRDALADGELGTATSEAELSTTITHLLEQPRPDCGALAAAVCARFGRESFAAGVRAALNRLEPEDDRELAVCS